MERYDSYKDSGVEWIGEIPTNWKSKRFSYSIDIQKGKIPKNLTDEKLVDSLPYLSMGVLRGDKPKEFSNESGIVHVSKGDIGLLWDGSNSGEVIRINREGILSSTVSLLSLKDDSIDKEFCFYLLKFYENDFRENTIGMGIPHVSGDHVRESKLIIPTFSEQQKIVSFLDKKTSLIDSLIEKTQQKIELLKEKRTSLINEVVTKGLNHNVEMKDSSVEWIGEIPSHWEITKMKYGVNHLSEKGKPEKSDIKISPENVESDTGVCFNLYSEHESEGMRFQSGDILLNKLRLYLKKILYTEYDGFSLGEMIVLRTNNKLNNKYFYQLLFSQGLIDLLDSQSTGIKLPRVSPEVILNTEIIYPPLSEQQQIVEYLDEQTQLIDKTITIEEKRIELLKEYRQSLISEVVTGKRKVV